MSVGHLKKARRWPSPLRQLRPGGAQGSYGAQPRPVSPSKVKAPRLPASRRRRLQKGRQRPGPGPQAEDQVTRTAAGAAMQCTQRGGPTGPPRCASGAAGSVSRWPSPGRVRVSLARAAPIPRPGRGSRQPSCRRRGSPNSRSRSAGRRHHDIDGQRPARLSTEIDAVSSMISNGMKTEASTREVLGHRLAYQRPNRFEPR